MLLIFSLDPTQPGDLKECFDLWSVDEKDFVSVLSLLVSNTAGRQAVMCITLMNIIIYCVETVLQATKQIIKCTNCCFDVLYVPTTHFCV